jgi:hypothetical protein
VQQNVIKSVISYRQCMSAAAHPRSWGTASHIRINACDMKTLLRQAVTQHAAATAYIQ